MRCLLMKKIFYAISFLIISSILFSNAFQQIEQEALFRFHLLQNNLDYAVISSKYIQKISTTPAMITVVNENQIRNMGAQSLPDILKTVPGVEVHRTKDGFYNIAFRGIRGNANVLFMINGHRINSFYDGVSLYNISAENIQRVEIIRGPGSSMHGTNAFVGVINVITKHYSDETSLNIVSDKNTDIRTSVIHGFSFDKYNFSVFAELFSGEGPEVSFIRDRTGQPGEMDTVIDQKNFNLSIKNKEDKHISLKYFSENRGLYLGPNYYADDKQNFSQEKLIFNYSNNFQINLQNYISTNFYVDISEINKFVNMGWNNRFGDPIPGYAKIDYNSRAIGFEVQYLKEFSVNHRLISGFIFETMRLYNYNFQTNFRTVDSQGNLRTDLGVEQIINYNDLNLPFKDHYKEFTQTTGTMRDNLFFTGKYAQNTDRQIMGVFIQDEITFNKFLGITLGARFDKYSDFGSTFNPKFGLVSNPYNPLIIKFGYSTAFRAPTFQELYDRTQMAVKNGTFGNPNLDAEEIKTIELGFEYNFTNNFKVNLNLYNNHIKNNIFPNNSSKREGANFKTTEIDPGDFYENIDGIKIKGFESELRYDFDDYNYFNLNYSWWEQKNLGGFRPQALSDYVTDYTSYITSQPQIRFNCLLNFNIQGISQLTGIGNYWRESIRKGIVFNIKYHYGYKRMNDDLDRREDNSSYSNEFGRRWLIPSYNIVDLSVRTTDKLWKNTFLTFSIDNITNEKVFDDYPDAQPFEAGTNYTENLIMPLPGRNYLFKVSINF